MGEGTLAEASSGGRWPAGPVRGSSLGSGQFSTHHLEEEMDIGDKVSSNTELVAVRDLLARQ